MLWRATVYITDSVSVGHHLDRRRNMMEEEEEIGRNALDEKGERNRRDKKSSVALI